MTLLELHEAANVNEQVHVPASQGVVGNEELIVYIGTVVESFEDLYGTLPHRFSFDLNEMTLFIDQVLRGKPRAFDELERREVEAPPLVPFLPR